MVKWMDDKEAIKKETKIKWMVQWLVNRSLTEIFMQQLFVRDLNVM